MNKKMKEIDFLTLATKLRFSWLAGGNYCANTSNFETHKNNYLQPKGSFLVLLVGFPIAKLLFPIKE